MTATVSATKFRREFGTWQRLVLREPIEVLNHERVTGYYVSAEEYARLKRPDRRVLATEDLRAWLVELIAAGEAGAGGSADDET